MRSRVYVCFADRFHAKRDPWFNGIPSCHVCQAPMRQMPSWWRPPPRRRTDLWRRVELEFLAGDRRREMVRSLLEINRTWP